MSLIKIFYIFHYYHLQSFLFTLSLYITSAMKTKNMLKKTASFEDAATLEENTDEVLDHIVVVKPFR